VSGPTIYAYVGGDSLNYIDPDGLSALGMLGGIAGTWGGRVLGGIGGEAAEPLGGGVPGAVLGGRLGGVVGSALGNYLDSVINSQSQDNSAGSGGSGASSGASSGAGSPSSGTEPSPDASSPPAPYPDNPEAAPKKFTRIKGTSAKVCKDDGSVWEPDTSSHGGKQWKRWPNKKAWDNGRPPNSIWPNGSVRK
jgi:hypothetical protein